MRARYAALSDEDLVRIIANDNRLNIVEQSIDEVFRRGDIESIVGILQVVNDNLFEASDRVGVILSKLSGHNDKVIINFLEILAKKYYSNQVGSIAQNETHIANAILERIDDPRMLEAAIALAKNHLLKVSSLPVTIIEGLSGRNDTAILEFLYAASRVEYPIGYNNVDRNREVVHRALQERSDVPELRALFRRFNSYKGCAEDILRIIDIRV